ncbi:MAG TPA: HD domain-containing phosphohydrolase, partial [Pyrinomonadaceae bacterium]|nr:HD domain-containing phosphohydrolase [Pyrinomonadaceae bacterium]
SGPAAIQLLEQHDVSIIICDQRMPGMSGIELLKATAQLRPHMVRILLTGYTDVEALVEAINCGLVYMYFTKPWNNEDLKMKVGRARDHYENNKKRSSLSLINERLQQRLTANTRAVVHSLSEMLRTRDAAQFEHAMRVRDVAAGVATNLGLNDCEVAEIKVAGLLSGLGKITRHGWRNPQLAAGKMSQAECELHLVESIDELVNVAEAIKCQSENFDGSGQPLGLGQEQIPLGARIIRVADEYALLTRAGDSSAMSPQDAVAFLRQGVNSLFDPKVIAALEEQPIAMPDRQPDLSWAVSTISPI